jgi:hypothetical protein
MHIYAQTMEKLIRKYYTMLKITNSYLGVCSKNEKTRPEMLKITNSHVGAYPKNKNKNSAGNAENHQFTCACIPKK